ncbi:MAG TPA: HD domain-containing phosphohydrolase, partial [Pseudothermotoga sp.]
ILIPESILQKPAPLTKQEYETVKEHTIKGSQILHDSINLHPENDTLMTIYEVIRHHHENYDGTGYPDGLSGLQIPLSARIVKVADVFDALTSDRYYRKAYSPQEALQMMKINMQNHFDPMIFEIFVEHYKFFFSFASGKRQ